MSENNTNGDKTSWERFSDEIELAGNQLVDRVKELIAEGNVRKIRVRSLNDDVVLELPLTAGAGIGGVVALAAPGLAALAAIAGILARVKVEIVPRDVPGKDEPQQPVEPPTDETRL